MTPDDRARVARQRAERYSLASLPELLIEAAQHADCRCRYPDGNGPPCGREQLAAELKTRATELASRPLEDR